MIGTILAELEIDSRPEGVCAAQWCGAPGGGETVSLDPSSGQTLAAIRCGGADDYRRVVDQAHAAFLRWRSVPPPQRGEIVRRFGQVLRQKKEALGRLVTLETGKILSEGLGEVQEMIDMCDFAAGLGRQLYGLSMGSERPGHRLLEQWHPLGVVGVISAFNFPVAVWSWNAALALVCGDAVVWKPSPLAALSAIAVQKLLHGVLSEAGFAGLAGLFVTAGHEGGTWLAEDRNVPLVSATGSCAMGRAIAPVIALRLGRALLELGGNNAAIVAPSAHLDLATRGVLFAAVGTAGQRCTTLRRLFVQRTIAKEFTERLAAAYASVTIGDPLDPGTLMGPLIRPAAVENVLRALAAARQQGAQVICGGERLERPGFFVAPALVKARSEMPIVAQETFGPILYVMEYDRLEDAIAANNGVEQGLSSAIFTDSVREAEQFLSASGSDCGLANVNTSTSGAEIGGAFGGEKASGGGREAGSDAWKSYMRRQTCTINASGALPLSQGVQFGG